MVVIAPNEAVTRPLASTILIFVVEDERWVNDVSPTKTPSAVNAPITVSPSWMWIPAELAEMCSLAVSPIVVIAANLAYVTWSSTTIIPLLFILVKVSSSSP